MGRVLAFCLRMLLLSSLFACRGEQRCCGNWELGEKSILGWKGRDTYLPLKMAFEVLSMACLYIWEICNGIA